MQANYTQDKKQDKNNSIIGRTGDQSWGKRWNFKAFLNLSVVEHWRNEVGKEFQWRGAAA